MLLYQQKNTESCITHKYQICFLYWGSSISSSQVHHTSSAPINPYNKEMFWRKSLGSQQHLRTSCWWQTVITVGTGVNRISDLCITKPIFLWCHQGKCEGFHTTWRGLTGCFQSEATYLRRPFSCEVQPMLPSVIPFHCGALSLNSFYC